MTKKIIFLFLMIVFGTNFYVNAQGTITIGTGTSSNSTTVHPTPYGTYYKNHRVQYLYLASELAAAGLVSGNITAIAFNVANLNTCSSMPNFTISAKQTTASALTTTFDPAGYTTVWTNLDFMPVIGWNTHTLSTPIAWDGTSNLLIDVCFTLIPGAYTQNASVYFTTTTGNLASSFRSDTEVACGTTLAATLPTTSDRANIQITGQVATCLPPTNISAGSLTPASANMSWTAGGTETLWDIYYGLAASLPVPPNASTTPTVSGLTSANYNITGLTTLTNYTFYVRANCGGGDKSLWAGPYNFTTPSSLLSGTYTIDKTQPTAGTNYNSFTAFASAINTGGLGGPVIVNVVAGTGPYTEQVTFLQPLNSSAVNTLTINGNGNTLEFLSSNTNERATLKFNGTDYVTVNNLIVKALGELTTPAQYGWAVWLTNNADYNTFDNCQFHASTTSTSTNFAGFVTTSSATGATTSGAAAKYLTVTNSIINGGYYGMVINGPTTAPFSTNNNISNNEIKDFYLYGIYTRGQNNSVFTGNNIHRTNRTASSTSYMFYLTSNISNTTISKNKIYSIAGSGTTTSTAYGIYATSITSPVNEGVLIANNAIYGFSLMNGTQYGIYLGTTGYARVYHNSVSMDNTTHTGSSAIYAFYHTGASANLDIKNNVFAYTTNSTGTKYNMYFATNTAVVSSNNNVLYKGASAGTNNTGYWNALAYNTLANWQGANGSIYDAQSVGDNPAFTANNNLKPTSALIDNIGTDLSSVVTDDILGIPRSAFSDPGAYEFTPQVMTIDSVNVIQTVTTSVGQSSTNNQMLRVGIYTQNSLNPLSLNNITFSTNGSTNATNDIQNAKLWTSAGINNFSGATQIGDISVNPNGVFTINNGTGIPMTLSPGVNYLWLTYDINGTATDQNLVDAEFVDVNISGTTYYPPVSAPSGNRKIRVFNGSYTVGTGGDFATLSEVFTDINSIGLAGNTTLNIISDITENSMLTLNEWAPLGNSFTLLIQPQGGARIISGSIATALLKLNGADRVTINGLNTAGNSLTFQNNSTATSTTVIWISSLGANAGATYNTIKNLNIIGGSATVTSQFGIYAAGTTVSTTGAGMDNDYLTLEGNSVSKVYYGIYTRGNGAPNQTDYLLIKKNNISNFGLTGIHCFFADAPVFQENILNSTVNNTGTKYGINVQNSTNAIKISKNNIYVTLGTSASGSIHGISLTNDTATVSNPAYIWNNMVSISGGVTQCYGIRDLQSHYNFIYNNSINVTGSSATDTRGINVAIGSTNVEVYNNSVLCNKYPIFIEKTNGVFAATASNYNNLFSTGTGNQYAYHNGTAPVLLASLAALQADGAYAMDANSISVDPIYFSTSDLHTENVSLMGMGTNLAWVTDDIDGEVRASIPCIGADEFTIPANDLLVKAVYTLGKLPIQGGAPHYVKAIIRNRGLATQSNINVSLNISGANNFTTNYTISSLASGAEDTVIFNGFTPTVVGLNNVKVSLPSDQLLTNNEMNVYQNITNTTFAYADTSAVTNGLGTTNAAGGMLLAKYYVNGTKNVYSTKAWIRGATTIGKELYGVVLNSAGVVLDTTFHKIITAADTSTWVNFSFIYPSATTTTNADIYVGIAMVGTAYFPVGFQTETPMRRYAFYINNSLSSISLVESAYKLMIEAEVGDPMDKDASITQVVNPSSGCALNNQSITIKIKNEGTQTITAANGLVASYKVDNGSVVSQNVNVDIAPLASVDFTFTTPANLAAATGDVNYLLTTWVDLSTDLLKVNDTSRKVVTSGYLPPSPIANNKNFAYATADTLIATPGSADTVVYWYNNINDTAYFYTGLKYGTPILYDTTTYYIASGGGKANLKITEITTYRTGIGQTPTYPTWAPGGDLAEITNLGNAKVDLLGYKFNVYGSGSRNYTIPVSLILEAGQILILHIGTGTDDLVNRYLNMGGSNESISSGSATGFVLYKPDNTVVDAVALYNFAFTTECTPSDWSGTLPTSSTFAGIIRTVSDNNVSSDWVVSSATTLQTMGSLNPTLTAGASSAGCQSSRVPIKAMISSFPAVDAGVANLTLPSTPVNGGSSVPVVVKIKNYGLNNLTAATIGWSINGINQTPYNWTGDVARGLLSSDITISNTAVTVAGVLPVKAWIISANTLADTYNTNDTASGSVLVKFGGTYTIGSGGDFASVDQVATALNAVGISDNVLFNILPGTYETRPIFNVISGTSQTQSIIFKSSTGVNTDVTLHYTLSTAAAFMMKFTGSSYITFKDLTMSVSGSATWGRVVELASLANNIEISNCILIGMPRATATTTNFSIIYGSAASLNNLKFTNNRFEGGYRAIELIGVSGSNQKFNQITDNIFNDFNYSGSYTTYQDTLLISGNSYTNLSTATSYSLYVGNSNSFAVLKNKLYRYGTTGTNYALYLATANASAGVSLVANNFIMQSNGTGASHGIYCSTIKNTRIFNNSVNITKGTTASYAFYNASSTAGADIRVLNNIFANRGGGYAYYASANVGIDSSNNNCLYATGTNLAYWGAARTSLAALQAVSFRDANSISVNPNFVNDTADLHATNVALPEKGVYVPEVTDDIDGQVRSILPTIGADEFLGTRTLNLTVMLEGLYNGLNMNPAMNDMGEQFGATIADQITVELRNSTVTSIVEATYTAQNLSVNGLCSITIPANLGDQYYIVVKHRNSVTTWSALPMSFNTSVINYNFTSSVTQAYGDNLKELAVGVYGIYTGDVNQDGLVDGSDMSDTEAENNNFAIGYVVTDVNGDGLVDGSDMSIVENANNNFVSEIMP